MNSLTTNKQTNKQTNIQKDKYLLCNLMLFVERVYKTML